MTDRLAVKALTQSDLSLFAGPYRRNNRSKQKAINLNRDVLVNQLYPALPEQAGPLDDEVPVTLRIWVSGSVGPHQITRKILKHASYKNWRLNGELIHGPETDPPRYDGLTPGTIAVMAFHGDALPRSIDLVLIPAASDADRPLFAALTAIADRGAGRGGMVALSGRNLRELLDRADPPEDHPLRFLTLAPDLAPLIEEFARGGTRGRETLRARLGARGMSREELLRARARADETGRQGEALVNAYFQGLSNPGGIWNYEWTSDRNAIAPYDFICRSSGGTMGETLYWLDVKSTAGRFESVLHISMAELLEAAAAPCEYRIYRVYDLAADGARLRCSDDIRDFARQLCSVHNGAMPAGVCADSFSVPVDAPGLVWGDVITIPAMADEDDQAA